MWAEARKQEKKIRGIMVDHKKRAERRREYYEKIVSKLILFYKAEVFLVSLWYQLGKNFKLKLMHMTFFHLQQPICCIVIVHFISFYVHIFKMTSV